MVKGGYGKVLKPAGKAIFDKGKTALDKVTGGRKHIITLKTGEQVTLSRAAYQDHQDLKKMLQGGKIDANDIPEINKKMENVFKEALQDANFKKKVLAEYGTSTLDEAKFLDDMKYQTSARGLMKSHNMSMRKRILEILLH